MRVVCDIEGNGLTPTQIWCIVCKDIDTNQYYIFRNVTNDEQAKGDFLKFAGKVKLWIGHNLLGYDYPNLVKLIGFTVCDISSNCIDTLVISKLVNYSRQEGHSIESYGLEFGLEKGSVTDFTHWSQELEDYCVRDVDICHRVYTKYIRVINDNAWRPAISCEQQFQLYVNNLHDNGFALDLKRVSSLHERVVNELEKLDKSILEAFPPRKAVIRTFTPKETKYGTINKTSVPKSLWDNISSYTVGNTYDHFRLVTFNPASHKQIVEVLSEAGWQPTEKTKAHITVEREINRAKYHHEGLTELDLKALSCKLILLKKFGWKISEENLSSLPSSAPAPARLLAKRIMYEARRRTLHEWVSIVKDDERIHGQYQGIGAWTHRMAHQKPNTANIPREFNNNNTVKLLGKEMRQCWIAPKGRLLVGVDAEGIQFRVFAHLINDTELIERIVNGKKSDKTDPHSYNQSVIGPVCKSRQAAKQTLYALFLGGAAARISKILDSTTAEAQEAIDKLLQRYSGFDYLRREAIPSDAKRGWFRGLDGRKVAIPGDTIGERRHLAMSGYLQNGEAVIMKRACILWHKQLGEKYGNINSLDSHRIDIDGNRSIGSKSVLSLGEESKEIRREVDWKFVNLVHDEYQLEVPNNMEIAIDIAKTICDCLRQVGVDLKLNCPIEGSYWSDDRNDYTIGPSWYLTH